MPAVAVNVATLTPAETFTEAGTLKAALLLERETEVPPAGATWLSVTVHVAEPLDPNVVGLQASADTSTGATSEIDALWEAPFKDAVMDAV